MRLTRLNLRCKPPPPSFWTAHCRLLTRMAGRDVDLKELHRHQQEDMPLSSAMAKELGRRLHTSGSAPAAASASSDELRAALSDLVDATLDEELTAQTREVANASNGEVSADNVQSLTERAADEIATNSPAYHMLQDAVRQAAAAAAPDTSTCAGTKCEDKGEASGHKKAKHDANINGSSNVLSNAIADEVWGTNDDDYDDDPFAFSNTSTPGAATSSNAGAVKSFSLFDMLDSQPGMGFSSERVSAQKILNAFGGTSGSNGGGDDTTMEDDSDARYNEAASLLERVDDLEDLLFDPFGESGGDSWPDINRVLRCGLGLADAGDTDEGSSAPTATAETPPSLDIIVRYAHIHSKLDGLCGSSSSSSGIDFGPQRMELLINMADALMAMHNRFKGKWCTIKDSGEVYMAEGIVTLVQIMLDMLISSAPALELAMEEDCHRLLLGIMEILVTEPSPERGSISLAHAISAPDPYAEWFSLLSRFVHQAALIKAAVEAGMLKKVVEICNEGPERQTTTVKSGTVPTNDSDMVAIGIAADLDHCLYLHSLSILRTLLVVTAASERAFPYQDIGVKAGNSLSENESRVLSPFINVLSVGAKGGIAVVDERLASLCEEASGTVLRASKPNKTVFEAVFQTIVSATLKGMVAANANPSLSAINRLQKLAS